MVGGRVRIEEGKCLGSSVSVKKYGKLIGGG